MARKRKRRLGAITPTMVKARKLAFDACESKPPYDLYFGCSDGVKFAMERANQTGGPVLSKQLAINDCISTFGRRGGDVNDCLIGVKRFFEKMNRLGRRRDG